MDRYERSFLPEGSRGDIQAAALEHLASKGLYEFTLAEVARIAAISRPRLAYHYTEKDDLLMDITHAWGQSGQAVTTETLQLGLGLEPRSLILKICEATFIWKRKCPAFAGFTPVLNQLAMHLPAFESAQKIVTDTGLKRIEELLRTAGCSKKHAGSLAQQLHWIMIGGFLYHLATPSSSPEQVQKITQTSINEVLNCHFQ